MQHHKYTQTIIKSLLLILFPITLLMVVTASTDHKIKADDEEIVVKPNFKPTKTPKKFIGIWLTSGYDLQPQADYYTLVDDPVTIRTNTGRSVWSAITGAFDGIHFRWWKTTDGLIWTEVDKNDNGQKKNFTVTPTEPGTTWYQLDTQYYKYITWYLKTHLYSQVTAVHALSEPVDALSIDVIVDDDYLYNTSDELSNTTFAHAKPNPANATGKLTWSIDDSSLATIDEDGQIVANNKGNSGIVTATATIVNNDGKSVSGSTTVEIGGGLDDQTVKSGQSATYTLKGNTGGDGDEDDDDTGTITIDWYKYLPGSNKKVKVASGDSTTYVTEVASMDDDESYYQAVITLKSGKITKTITSNKAKLTVIPSGEPDIDIDNTLNNETYTDSDDTDLLLNNVVNEDNITYNNTLTNQSSEGLLKNGYYVIPMRQGTKVNQILMNGEELAEDQYEIIPEDDDNSDNLVMSIGNINTNADVKIEVNTTVQNITQQDTFKSTPYVYGTDNDGNLYRREARNEVINYISNQIETNIKNIDYGTLIAYKKNILKYRPDEINNPNNIVDISDNRRTKDAMNVYVSQQDEFTHETSGAVLPVSLRYYQNGSFQNIINDKIPVSSSQAGDELASIGWNKADGLLLHVDDSPLFAGKYTTSIIWHFENSL
ncbi:hypothetical protein ACFQAV_06405 [Companilactobacillus huachuanensis]|uniref:BIG2 domain-containing protein n=1 Tax=Companilactobacillus huachuanensis TaxID=2559914 RepID=A0ABW1RP22_9LACO|nr:hypothetical protein [Companilactobacillus huachuanensis]